MGRSLGQLKLSSADFISAALVAVFIAAVVLINIFVTPLVAI